MNGGSIITFFTVRRVTSIEERNKCWSFKEASLNSRFSKKQNKTTHTHNSAVENKTECHHHRRCCFANITQNNNNDSQTAVVRVDQNHM
jgi:hypothetical protein